MASQSPRAEEAVFCFGLPQITAAAKAVLNFQSLSSDSGAIQRADSQLIDLQACPALNSERFETLLSKSAWSFLRVVYASDKPDMAVDSVLHG